MDKGRFPLQRTVLKEVLTHLRTGRWPQMINNIFRPYYDKREEMSIEVGIILWGLKVVIPSSLQRRIVNELVNELH